MFFDVWATLYFINRLNDSFDSLTSSFMSPYDACVRKQILTWLQSAEIVGQNMLFCAIRKMLPISYLKSLFLLMEGLEICGPPKEDTPPVSLIFSSQRPVEQKCHEWCGEGAFPKSI